VDCFFFLVFENLWKLIPYVIRVSSNLVKTFSLAVVMWRGIILSRLAYKLFQFFSHFTITGRPIGLIPFLKIIEVIRKLIRPITLGVRLAVKLITGHLLLRMFRKIHYKALLYRNLVYWGVLLVFGLGVLFYERCICVIQGLVYSLMLVQYYDEHSK